MQRSKTDLHQRDAALILSKYLLNSRDVYSILSDVAGRIKASGMI